MIIDGLPKKIVNYLESSYVLFALRTRSGDSLESTLIIGYFGLPTYKLELLQELSRVYSTFHLSNLKKCYSDEPLAIPLDGLHIDDKLYFVEELVEIMDREVKRLKQSRIPIVTCEREDQFQKKYPHLFTKPVPSSSIVTRTLRTRLF
ncbi:hypothetical protein Tco_0144947 [Tanacetum coccineum]